MRFSLLAAVFLLTAVFVAAQRPSQLPPPNREIPLYAGVAPGSESWNYAERTFVDERGFDLTQDVVRPVLLYYAPDPAKANGTAVIVAPGGGGVNLAIRYEGIDVARKLSAEGVAAFVLKYRLIHATSYTTWEPTDDHDIVLSGPQKGQNVRQLESEDGLQAMRWLRTHCAEFGCTPHRIGFVGFSMGGIVAIATVAGPAASRPDFFAPIYGPGDGDLVPSANAPPLFLAAAADDDWATEGSLALFKAWRAAKHPAEIHIFQMGGHAFLKKGGGGDQVIDRLIDWMRTNGWLARQLFSDLGSRSGKCLTQRTPSPPRTSPPNLYGLGVLCVRHAWEQFEI